MKRTIRKFLSRALQHKHITQVVQSTFIIMYIKSNSLVASSGVHLKLLVSSTVWHASSVHHFFTIPNDWNSFRRSKLENPNKKYGFEPLNTWRQGGTLHRDFFTPDFIVGTEYCTWCTPVPMEFALKIRSHHRWESFTDLYSTIFVAATKHRYLLK